VDRLWEIIEKEKIRVLYEDLSGIPEKPHGLYLHDTKIGAVIVLDINLNHSRRLKKCVLAEEIGHFYTAPRTNVLRTYTSSNDQIMLSQDERKAAQWSTDFLVPDALLAESLRAGCRSCFELAEYCDVTEWFMCRKLGLLKMCFRRSGLKVRGKDLFDIEIHPCNIF
jgi:Zn-dependent peptidase ImmA (M78 family)